MLQVIPFAFETPSMHIEGKIIENISIQNRPTRVIIRKFFIRDIKETIYKDKIILSKLNNLYNQLRPNNFKRTRLQ